MLRIVFVTFIGDISDSECFASATEPKNSLPLHELFYLAEQMGAPAVMFTSTSSGSIAELHECDIDFTRRLIDGGGSGESSSTITSSSKGHLPNHESGHRPLES